MSDDEAQLPTSFLVSCSDDCSVARLVRYITDDFKNDDNGDDVNFIWNVDTKYYEAKVQLIGVSKKKIDETLKDSELLDSAGALVIYYDGNFENNSEIIKKVNDLTQDAYNVGVKILVCDSCKEESKGAAQQWCVDQGIEHLELEGEEAETERLKQALEAHIWPNMIPKSSNSKSRKQKSNIPMTPGDDVDFDDFSSLFGQLATMKEQAASLPMEDRKNFAEQVVLAYWKSIGGDEDELLDA